MCRELMKSLLQERPFSNRGDSSSSWDVKQVELQIVWSKTAWKLAKLPGDAIESISVEMGGDANKEGETDVVVTLFPNTSSSERSQELMLTNFSTKEIIRLKITQQTTSVSSKITLNPDVSYQKVTGFGGMLNPSWTGNNLRDADVQKLYGDLGYNIIRMMLYPNKADWGLNTATAKKAQSLVTVFASPWSPPASMKSNGKLSNEDGATYFRVNTDYATHIKDFRLSKESGSEYLCRIHSKRTRLESYLRWMFVDTAQMVSLSKPWRPTGCESNGWRSRTITQILHKRF